jgi:hypothetical protein
MEIIRYPYTILKIIGDSRKDIVWNLKKNDHNGKYIEGGSKNKINFALDDFEVLENEFKDVIRDNKLKKILRDV